MKKLRIVMRIATGVLVLFTIAGIVMLVVNDELDFFDTAYEIIAFSLGAAGMIMAIISQIDYYQSDKQSQRILKEIDELNREHDTDEKVDKDFQKKLDTILQGDQKIYHRLERSQQKPDNKVKNE
jgi:spermidine/putrescine-binding protein